MAGDGSTFLNPYPDQVGWLQSSALRQQLPRRMLPAPDFIDIVVFGLQQMLPIIFVSYFVGLNIEGLFAVGARKRSARATSSPASSSR